MLYNFPKREWGYFRREKKKMAFLSRLTLPALIV